MVRRRTLSILALTLACVAAVAVVAALAAAPPNLGRALEAQRKLAAERPQDAGVWNDLGNLYILARQSAEAENAYRTAVTLDPQRVSALFNLGLLLQEKSSPREALRLFHQVVELQPEHAWAHYQIGALYETWGQSSKAVAEYARAFSLDPQLAFPEVNPHVVNKLLTESMLRAYREGYALPQAPSVYEDPQRIAKLLVTPPAAPDAAAPKDATAATPKTPPTAVPGAPPGAAGKAPAGSVIREGDLDTRVTGQAGPQGSVRARPGTRVPTQVPRGSREWERPEPTIQYPSDPSEEIQPPVPAPGQVITTPPPGGIYYRPGVQSTGRLNRQVVPEQREGRG
jgi:hypothetical protein